MCERAIQHTRSNSPNLESLKKTLFLPETSAVAKTSLDDGDRHPVCTQWPSVVLPTSRFLGGKESLHVVTFQALYL
jgi:hypothetical protein